MNPPVTAPAPGVGVGGSGAHTGAVWLLASVVFVLYLLVSFVRVALYTAREVRAGRFLTRTGGPRSFQLQPLEGWAFVAVVLALLLCRSAFYELAVVLIAAAILVRNRTSAVDQFGLRRLEPGRLVRWSVLICGAVLLLEKPLMRGVEILIAVFHLPNPEQESVETFRGLHAVSDLVLFIGAATLLAPLIEELFFRGFLQVFLKRYLPVVPAVVVSSGLFAAAHLNYGAFLPLWLLGFILGLAYEHTGCLALCIGVHACWNFFTAAGLLLERAGG